MNFHPAPILSAGRILLRPLSQSDISNYLTVRNDERVNQYIQRVKQLSTDEAVSFVNRMTGEISASKVFYWALCLKENDRLIGTVCLWNFSEDKKSAEVGYELNPEYQGKGIMNEAIGRVLHFATNELQLHQLEAWVHKDNSPSIRLLLKHKFVLDAGRTSEESPGYVVYKLSNARPVLR